MFTVTRRGMSCYNSTVLCLHHACMQELNVWMEMVSLLSYIYRNTMITLQGVHLAICSYLVG